MSNSESKNRRNTRRSDAFQPQFTYTVGELAKEECHHPDLHLSWGEVVVEMWTHKIDGLFETDFIMAARMDQIYDDYAPYVLV